MLLTSIKSAGHTDLDPALHPTALHEGTSGAEKVNKPTQNHHSWDSTFAAFQSFLSSLQKTGIFTEHVSLSFSGEGAAQLQSQVDG